MKKSHKYSVNPFMEIQAKQTIQCDHCKCVLDPAQDELKENIQASFNNSQGKSQKFHFCNEAHLREFLVEREKKRRKARANASLEIDFYEKE
jgi:hypothetical protein